MNQVLRPAPLLCEDGELLCTDGSLQCLALFFEATVPEITQAGMNPNPVNMNTTFLLSVEVTETTVYLDPYFYYAGDIYAGEADA